jgi:hypothetical protein
MPPRKSAATSSSDAPNRVNLRNAIHPCHIGFAIVDLVNDPSMFRFGTYNDRRIDSKQTDLLFANFKAHSLDVTDPRAHMHIGVNRSLLANNTFVRSIDGLELEDIPRFQLKGRQPVEAFGGQHRIQALIRYRKYVEANLEKNSKAYGFTVHKYESLSPSKPARADLQQEAEKLRRWISLMERELMISKSWVLCIWDIGKQPLDSFLSPRSSSAL